LSDDYYTTRLSSNKLKQCYDIAPPRVFQYLNAEIKHTISLLRPTDDVLELGCGYGRVIERLAQHVIESNLVGIDTSRNSLELARETFLTNPFIHIYQMDAGALGFRDGSFDKVICIQNGISAFKIDPSKLLEESIRVTRDGGICIFSSYFDGFWKHRLNWFELQAENGLIGEIDWDETGEGVIVCKDGFRATTFSAQDFRTLTDELRYKTTIKVIDQSSVFCEIYVER
jgi:2-polyprenyl-6-hydroxyphenyl methylase/3-demethylubiquinone-9 3-methyltransferase